MRFKTFAALPVAAALAVVAACSQGGGAAETSEEGLTKLKVATTVVGPTYWPFYYTPQVLGFYEDEGLDVEIVPINSGVTQSLLSGQIDIGGAGFDFVQQGGEVDQLAWYLMTDRHLFVPMVTGDSPIQTGADLAGKKIGINEANDSFDAEFVLTANGVEHGDYELVPIGEAAPAAKALAAGEIDAMIIPATTSYLQAREAAPDADIRIVDTQASANFYNTGLMAKKDFLQENRDVAIRFGRAIAKGIIWMNENPEATAEMILDMEPEAAESLDVAVEQVQRAVEWNEPIYKSRGQIDGAVLQREVDLLADLDLIDEPYDAGQLFDDSMAEEIWDFDVDAEVARARADERP